MTWISVRERVPREEELMLLHDGQFPYVGYLYCGKWNAAGKWTDYRMISHWMPLPAPPPKGD